jgi:hypothetical protein
MKLIKSILTFFIPLILTMALVVAFAFITGDDADDVAAWMALGMVAGHIFNPNRHEKQ